MKNEWINPMKIMFRHILVKLLNIKDKVLKMARETAPCIQVGNDLSY